jgi:hypothetical protein
LYNAQSFDEATSEDISINRVEEVLDYLIEIKNQLCIKCINDWYVATLVEAPYRLEL